MIGRVRASALDNLSYFLQSDTLTTERFVERVCGREPDNEATEFGTKFHKALEDAVHTAGVVAFRGFDFVTVAVRLLRPQATEFEAQLTYRDGDDTIIFTGHCDAIAGRTIIDYKTTAASQIDLEKYMESLQWRAYLALNERADRVRYEVFRFSKDRSKLMEHDYIELSRYAGMDDDVRDAVLGYWQYVKMLAADGWIIIAADGRLTYGPKMGPHHYQRTQEAAKGAPA